jgi:hypothetical protein
MQKQNWHLFLSKRITKNGSYYFIRSIMFFVISKTCFSYRKGEGCFCKLGMY